MNKTISFAKFTAVAIMLVFISPTITTQNGSLSSTSIAEVEFSILNSAEAREDRKKNRNRNKNKNVNKNKNTNKNTNVNVNVNNNKRRGVRPLGVLAGMAIGATVVASAMSPGCTTVIVNGISYRKCDGTYFQPSGSNYIVVNSPY